MQICGFSPLIVFILELCVSDRMECFLNGNPRVCAGSGQCTQVWGESSADTQAGRVGVCLSAQGASTTCHLHSDGR